MDEAMNNTVERRRLNDSISDGMLKMFEEWTKSFYKGAK